jgi:hypothetical protein
VTSPVEQQQQQKTKDAMALCTHTIRGEYPHPSPFNETSRDNNGVRRSHQQCGDHIQNINDPPAVTFHVVEQQFVAATQKMI